ncbi:MAG: FtsX-like permease family protein [Lentimicrobium sp.]|nr:FtsX-like permease family protein [Lentimicrobium sp.]
MISNYIRSARRNFSRNKFYSIINILGLTLGLTVTFFILLYINDELGYDKHFANHERIYRLEGDFTINNKHDRFAVSSAALAPALKIEFPEIEKICRFASNDNAVIKYNEKEFYEKNIYFADSAAPEIFTLKFSEGNPAKALNEPFTIILSKSTAQKYFGAEQAYGKTLLTGNGNSFKVTGVFDDLPDNTHLKFDMLMSMNTLAKLFGYERFNSLEPIAFWNVNFYSYILLKPNSSIETVQAKFPSVYNKYMKEIGDQLNASFDLLTTRLDKIHHTSKLSADRPVGNMAYIYVFAAVAIFILLLASINYMNLATARATNRAREVGLRKVVGANRGQLAFQFLSESVLLSVAALILSFALIQLLLPAFNELSGKKLTFSLLTDPGILVGIVGIGLLTGLLSGIYPALVLSSFQPAMVLKGKLQTGIKGSWLRKGLVTFQLVISVIMITGTIVIYNQLSFMRNADLGFDKNNVMVVEIQDTTFRKKIDKFREELLQNPSILAASMSNGVPGGQNGIQVMRVEKDNKMQEYALNLIPCDYNFPELLKLDFVAGRTFNREMGTDKLEAVIINEATAAAMGWGKNAIGKKIHFGFELDGTGGRMLKVIGVVKDFNFTSLHNKVEPLVMFIPDFPSNILLIRLKQDYTEATMDYISKKWNQFGANRPFDYYFLDKDYESKYQSESKLGTVFATFSALSIFIALLGLLGLSSFIAMQRSKEIGIRKVLGSSVEAILRMLYRESVILVLIACAVAIPIAHYFLNDWLGNFAYHTEITWITYLLSGLASMLVAILSVSFHAIKAATSNPVNSIKYE